jgi:O-methyltransferase involved in polyketide biosynthesis
MWSGLVAQSGEPMRTMLDPTAAAALMKHCGLRVAEHPTREDLHQRYFAERSDGLTPWSVERLIAAAAP